MKVIEEGYTFDDVLLIPQRSDIRSRKDVDISTKLTNEIKLNIPIISSNMDTITEANMAIAMAREGGLGIIHRYLSIEQQINEIKKVKRAQSYVITDPLTLGPHNTIDDLLTMSEGTQISGVIVVDDSKNILGIVTKRDILFEPDHTKKLSQVMTKKVITAEYGLTLDEAEHYFKLHKIEKLPLVDKKGKLKGLITTKDLLKNELFPKAVKDSKGRLLVGAAVGVRQSDMDRAVALVDAGADILVIDIAHGHSKHTIEMIKKIKKTFKSIPVAAGNVATPKGLQDLAEAGADIIKVGVGPGTTCITRIVTGSGYPQLSAIMNCSKEAKKLGVSIIADGGIRTSGDTAKALAAGADAVMLGGFLSGTEEAPGITIVKNGRKFKMMRGMASLEANIERKDKKENLNDIIDDITPEGVEALVPYKGSVSEVLSKLIGGIRSGFSYCGARDIKGLWKNSRFVKITPAGMSESKPHDLEILR